MAVARYFTIMWLAVAVWCSAVVAIGHGWPVDTFGEVHVTPDGDTVIEGDIVVPRELGTGYTAVAEPVLYWPGAVSACRTCRR